MSTFSLQSKLEKLPIPDLNDTCRKYLEILKPLQTEKEHATTIEAVERFLKSPMSKHLDEQLRQYAKVRSLYIEEFWYDSYLNYDSPVVLNLNPFFLIEDDPNPVRPSQTKRAALITVSSLRFIRALRREELPPDVIKGQPLDMYQYTKLFAAARIPTPSGCIMQSDNALRHIAVLSRLQFYWFNVLDENNDLLLDEAGLFRNYNQIVKDSRKTSLADVAKLLFGLLTTENRRVWASLREKMNSTANNDILRIVDLALFIVCLDDVEIELIEELAVNLLCGTSKIENGVQVGTCTNRWYDKLQLIVTRNLKVGINFEHTGVDGHTVLRFVSDVYTDLVLLFVKTINPNAPSIWKSDSLELSQNPSGVDVSPQKLGWELTPDLLLSLRFAETRLLDLIAQTEFAVLEFKGYGLSLIKKFGCLPDAFVQMSFQAAYYALYGKVECTYEPAMTKKFLHGRTEAIRTVSQELNQYVRKFFEDISPHEKLELLRTACKKHSQRTKEALEGLGVDRHLYALFCIWQRYVASSDQDSESDGDSDVTAADSSEGFSKEVPSIFANSGWDKLNNLVLLTSNCGNPALRLFGFGPVTLNGFGISYIIKLDLLTILACLKHRQTKRFINTLNSYYAEVSNLYNATSNAEPIEVDSDVRNNRFRSLSTTLKEPSKSSAALNYLLGGYGYFDVGEDEMKSRGQSPEPPFNRPDRSGFNMREIEKKLRLAEY